MELAEARIASQEPTSRGDAVGLVVDLAGIESVEIWKEVLSKQFGVQRRDSIDRIAANHRKVAIRTIALDPPR
jgi:hypothetical protein